MLTQSVESYIALRRATGFAFRSEGSLLQSFAAFSDAAGKRYVSADTAIEWAGSAPSLCQRARRLGQVIRFARYIRAEDAHHEIPPTVFGSESRPRPVPYIFSAEEIKRILQTASGLGKRNAFRGHTYNTLFALLACTGLRVCLLSARPEVIQRLSELSWFSVRTGERNVFKNSITAPWSLEPSAKNCRS